MKKKQSSTKKAGSTKPTIDRAELLRNIQDAHLQNLLAKTADGSTLTAQEFAFVQSRLLEEDPTEDQGLPTWAPNATAAGRLLGVSRERLSRWRRKYVDAPRKASNGREPVRAWRSFIEERGLLRGQDQGKDLGDERRKAEARKIQAQAEFLEHRMEAARGKLIDRDLVAQTIVGFLIGLRTRLITNANGLASRAAMFKKPDQIKRLLLTSYRSTLREAGKNKFASFACPHCRRHVRPRSE